MHTKHHAPAPAPGKKRKATSVHTAAPKRVRSSPSKLEVLEVDPRLYLRACTGHEPGLMRLPRMWGVCDEGESMEDGELLPGVREVFGDLEWGIVWRRGGGVAGCGGGEGVVQWRPVVWD